MEFFRKMAKEEKDGVSQWSKIQPGLPKVMLKVKKLLNAKSIDICC